MENEQCDKCGFFHKTPGCPAFVSKRTNESASSPKESAVQSAQLAALRQYAEGERQSAIRLFESMKHSMRQADVMHCAMCLGRKQAFESTLDWVDAMERKASR